MTDRQLYDLLKQDPEAGVHQLLNQYGAAIKTICKNFLYDCTSEDVEDAVAETVIRMWQGLDHFIPDDNHSIKSYLYAIARNTARNKRKVLKRASVFSLEDVAMELISEENVESDYEYRQQTEILHQCIQEMGEPDRSIFLCRYFYGFKNAEIADKLSLVPKQVENILYRGKKRLKKALEERGIFHDE